MENDSKRPFAGENLDDPTGAGEMLRLRSYEETELRRWIKAICHEANIKPTALAKKAGVAPSTINRFVKGQSKNKPNSTTLKKIIKAAQELGVITEDEATPNQKVELTPIHSLSTVKVVGVVEAGAWRSVEDVGKELFSIAVPPGVAAGAQKYGLEVRGESMNKIYPHGTIVICIKLIENGFEPENGRRVVVERTQNGFVEATVKQWRNGQLWPESTDPDHQEPLDVSPESADGHEEVRITGLVVGSYRPE